MNGLMYFVMYCVILYDPIQDISLLLQGILQKRRHIVLCGVLTGLMVE